MPLSERPPATRSQSSILLPFQRSARYRSAAAPCRLFPTPRGGRSTSWEKAGSPAAVAVRSDSRQAFVANPEGRSIAAIDLAAARVLAHLPLSARPEFLRFSRMAAGRLVRGGIRAPSALSPPFGMGF